MRVTYDYDYFSIKTSSKVIYLGNFPSEVRAYTDYGFVYFYDIRNNFYKFLIKDLTRRGIKTI